MAEKFQIPGIVLPNLNLAEYLIKLGGFTIISEEDKVKSLKRIKSAAKSERLILIVEQSGINSRLGYDVPFIIRSYEDISNILIRFHGSNFVYIISDKKL